MLFVLTKLVAIGIAGWLLMQTLTLKYAWTRDIADLDWGILMEPRNVVVAAMMLILLWLKPSEAQREGR